MPALDRAALRMGSAELITRADVPTAVVLAETVDLASRFSTDGSGRFVNGLLARVAREVRGEPAGSLPPLDELRRGLDDEDDDADDEELALRPAAVDGVIIDLDGVIRHWDATYLPAVERRLGLPAGAVAAVAFEDDRLARTMDGRISFPEWCAEIGAVVARDHGVDAAAVGTAWAESGWDIDLTVMDLVAAVRARVPVVLLSNASTNLRADLERSGIDDAFDAIAGSADLGAAKPDRGAFEAAAALIGIPLDRCLFVDDTEGHVRAARAMGLKAEVFTDAEALRELLRGAGPRAVTAPGGPAALPLPDPPLADGALRLRPWTVDDAPALAAAWLDPEVACWTGVPPVRDVAAARRWIEGDLVRRSRRRSLDLAVDVDGVLGGEVGLTAFTSDSAEIGWWVGLDHRRRGVATRAVRLVAAWATGPLGLSAVVARCHPDNPPSGAVAHRAGFLLDEATSTSEERVWTYDPTG